MSVFSPRRCALLAVPALVGGVGLATVAAPVHAVSPDVVVAEVYGGGGNSGATYTHDFVELANRGTTPVSLDGWSVQYGSAAGTSWQVTPLSGSIPAGGRYLVQQAAGAGGTTPLPTPDVVGSIPMSATSGKVALVTTTSALTCGTDCAEVGTGVRDFVGYGSANDFETAPAPGLSNTTSATRTGTDTDNNGADFAAASPTPQNSGQTPPPDEPETIAEVQGTHHLSPLRGRAVNDVAGVVVARSSNGFWMQSSTPDADAATSEGLFVFTGSRPTVAAGDAVTVDGTVTEFRPGGSGGNDNLTTTELTGATVTVASSGNPLPAPVVIGEDRVAPQQTIEADDPVTVESPSAAFRPDRDAIDFYESLEGMVVGVRDAKVVGPTKSFGELTVVPGSGVTATRSSYGGVVYGGYDQPNAMRLQLDDLLIGRAAMPNASVGDSLAGLASGVLDYSFANFKVLVTAPPALVAGGVQREVATPRSKDGDLSVATFNVENLSAVNPQDKFDRLARQVVTHLHSPDILALEEIQDDSGPANDGTVDSTATTDKLAAAIVAAGGPAYEARWVNPAPGNLDGGQPGGNIRQVFFFRPDREVEHVDAPGGDATTATAVVRRPDGIHLTHSPGRIDPASPAWASSRKPLAAEFRFRGQTVFAIANHFASKGGDDPLFGRWQQPVRSSEEQRHEQAQEVREFVDTVLAADGAAKVVVLGDINDFEFSRTTDILVGSGATALTDLPRTLSAGERYSYVFEGNSQVLDHILISPSLALARRDGDRAFVYDSVHTNSLFHDQDSDHDPQLVHLNLKK